MGTIQIKLSARNKEDVEFILKIITAMKKEDPPFTCELEGLTVKQTSALLNESSQEAKLISFYDISKRKNDARYFKGTLEIKPGASSEKIEKLKNILINQE